MKFVLFLLLIVSTLKSAFAQQLTIDSINYQQQKINKTGFAVIGGWSAANIIYSIAATYGSKGSNRYFHQMNGLWNGVNLGITALGYLGNRFTPGLALSASLKKQNNTEKIFLLNTGLDAAYITTGLFLKERSYSSSKNSDKLKGYGNSIMLQGAALLVFDGVMYLLHNRNGKRYNAVLEKLSFSAGPQGFGMLMYL